MRLSEKTIEAIKDRIEQLEPDQFDYAEDYAEWISVKAELQSVAANPTIETLAANHEAMDEIYHIAMNYSGEVQPAESKSIDADLCRAGFHEKFDPNTVWSRRPKTRVVDGVKYVIG